MSHGTVVARRESGGVGHTLSTPEWRLWLTHHVAQGGIFAGFPWAYTRIIPPAPPPQSCRRGSPMSVSVKRSASSPPATTSLRGHVCLRQAGIEGRDNSKEHVVRTGRHDHD